MYKYNHKTLIGIPAANTLQESVNQRDRNQLPASNQNGRHTGGKGQRATSKGSLFCSNEFIFGNPTLR